MNVTVRISFFIDYNLRNDVENFFSTYGIKVISPEKGRGPDIRYLIHITRNNGDGLQQLLAEIITNLKAKFNLTRIGEHFYYECSDLEYNQSPFFQVLSTGNSAKSHLDDNGNRFEITTFCPKCNLQIKNQTNNLTIDTSIMRKKYMVNVGSQFWVISEQMANLMEQHNLKGYSLKEVKHKGNENNAVPAYQLIPTTEMPRWSEKMKHYYFIDEKEEKCFNCGVQGRVDYPYSYNLNDLSQIDVDVIKSKEYTNNGLYAYQTLLISKKFRNLLLDHKITRDVRSHFSENYGRNDWLLVPVIVVND